MEGIIWLSQLGTQTCLVPLHNNLIVTAGYKNLALQCTVYVESVFGINFNLTFARLKRQCHEIFYPLFLFMIKLSNAISVLSNFRPLRGTRYWRIADYCKAMARRKQGIPKWHNVEGFTLTLSGAVQNGVGVVVPPSQYARFILRGRHFDREPQKDKASSQTIAYA